MWCFCILGYFSGEFPRKHRAKRNTLTLRQKLELIKASDAGVSSRQLAKQFQIGRTQAGAILKNRAQVLEEFQQNCDLDLKKRRLRKPIHEDVNDIVYRWYQTAQSLSIPVTGAMLQSKAKWFAEKLGNNDFKASNGWLHSFRKRHQIVFGAVCGGVTAAVEPYCDTGGDWVTSLIQDYRLEDVYLCGEMGLLYRALPDVTMNQQQPGLLQQLTVLLCCNATGTDLYKPLVIGTADRPQCFHNLDLNQLPVFWKANRKSLMNRQLFAIWLMEFDRHIGNQKRRVMLLVDNVPSHPADVPLKHVTLKYFPSLALSQMHPLEKAMEAMRQNYRRLQLRSVVVRVDNPESLTDTITELDACLWLAKAWQDTDPATVTKCFVQSGFSGPPSADSASQGSSSTNAELQQLIGQCSGMLHLSQPMPVQDFITVDKHIWIYEELECLAAHIGWPGQVVPEPQGKCVGSQDQATGTGSSADSGSGHTTGTAPEDPGSVLQTNAIPDVSGAVLQMKTAPEESGVVLQTDRQALRQVEQLLQYSLQQDDAVLFASTVRLQEHLEGKLLPH